MYLISTLYTFLPPPLQQRGQDSAWTEPVHLLITEERIMSLRTDFSLGSVSLGKLSLTWRT